MVKLDMRRVILFTDNLERMSRFYGDVLGLALVSSEPGWREFGAGGCNIALHEGKSSVGTRPPKLAFFASDVAEVRSALVERGAAMGKLLSSPQFDMCDGRDPDGNRFQISGRI